MVLEGPRARHRKIVKSASTTLKNFIPSTRQFFEADLFTVTPTAGAVRRYTNCDRDIVWQSNTYLSSSSGVMVQRSGLTWAVGLTVDTLDLTIDAPGLASQLATGLFDGARVQLDRLFGTAFGAWVDSVTLFAGNIADIRSLGRTRCDLTVRSRLDLLNNSFPRLLYQPSCRWTLFDAGCTLNKASFAHAVTIASVVNGLTLNTTATDADGFYDLGTLTFTSGTLNGLSATIKKYLHTSGQVILHVPLNGTPSNGDALTLYPGCDKTSATCNGKFANLINFGGEEFVPVPEAAF